MVQGALLDAGVGEQLARTGRHRHFQVLSAGRDAATRLFLDRVYVASGLQGIRVLAERQFTWLVEKNLLAIITS